MRIFVKIQRNLGDIIFRQTEKMNGNLTFISRQGSFSVWPSTLYEKMSITGEKETAPANNDKLTALDVRPDRGMLFIIGAPCLPKEEARKTYTANTLMINTADHPSYYDLQVENNHKNSIIIK
uniref:50S ribosomal protein L3 n=1 Tax=Lygus hesperus TaxID=30085 RepID=A0A0A9WP73_LYGHE